MTKFLFNIGAAKLHLFLFHHHHHINSFLKTVVCTAITKLIFKSKCMNNINKLHPDKTNDCTHHTIEMRME